MAQSTLSPDSKEEQDARYSPERLKQEEALKAYASAGSDQLEAFANDPKNATKEGEENPDGPVGKEGLYNPRAAKGGRKKKSKLTGKAAWRRRGVIGGVVAAFIAGGGALSLLFTPSIALVQLKEVMTNDLNDQLTAIDLRTDALWRAKLGDFTSGTGICTNVVQIKCKFSTMSKKQVDRFKRAGFTIADADLQDTAFGRQRILKMTAPNGAEITNPQDLFNERRNPDVRASMNRIFNPIYASLSDSIANNTFAKRFLTSKAAKFTGTSQEELDESMRNATAGEDAGSTTRTVVQTDERGEYVLDKDGNPIYSDQEGYDAAREQAEAGAREVADRTAALDGTAKTLSSVAGGVLKGVSVIGAVDNACTVYNMSRAVAAAAKAARSLQLAQYAMVYLNVADKIKAGNATPEEVEYLGQKLMEVDQERQIIDELSDLSTTYDQKTDDISLQDLVDDAELRDNPYYGANALDSAGYKVAANNEAPILSTRDLQYTTGGGLSGTLSSVNDSVAETLGGPEGIRDTCNVVQSWWVRGAGLVIGVAAAVGSFGASTAISIGASLAVAISLPFLEAALADIVAGQVVNEDTQGVDAGNAIFAGSSTLLGGVAQSRGMVPGTEETLPGYLAKTQQVQNEYIAQAKYEAQDQPLDVLNQYSFLGSFVRTLSEPVTAAKTSVASAIGAIPDILSTSLSALIPNASAVTGYNPERFNRCIDDAGYNELGIKADVFCNIRYVMPEEDLARDSLEVVDYMVENGHLNNDGLVTSGSYNNFMQYCVERTDGWGETGEEQSNDWTTGSACIEGTSDSPAVTTGELSYFRVYTMDRTIVAAMDEEELDWEALLEESEAATPTYSSNGSKQELAQRIIAKNKVEYLGNVTPTLEQIADGSVDPDAFPCGINIYILRIIDAVTEKHSIKISDLNRACKDSLAGGASSSLSRHYNGNGSAIDIAVVDGVASTGRNANDLSVISIARPIMIEAAAASGTYAGVGQAQCGGGVAAGDGIHVFNDFCHHIHLDVGGAADPNLEYRAGW